MTTKEEEQLNQKIKAIKAKKDAAAAEYARLVKQKASKEKKEAAHKEWERLWKELKGLYAKKKELAVGKGKEESKKADQVKRMDDLDPNSDNFIEEMRSKMIEEYDIDPDVQVMIDDRETFRGLLLEMGIRLPDQFFGLGFYDPEKKQAHVPKPTKKELEREGSSLNIYQQTLIHEVMHSATSEKGEQNKKNNKKKELVGVLEGVNEALTEIFVATHYKGVTRRSFPSYMERVHGVMGVLLHVTNVDTKETIKILKRLHKLQRPDIELKKVAKDIFTEEEIDTIFGVWTEKETAEIFRKKREKQNITYEPYQFLDDILGREENE